MFEFKDFSYVKYILNADFETGFDMYLLYIKTSIINKQESRTWEQFVCHCSNGSYDKDYEAYKNEVNFTENIKKVERYIDVIRNPELIKHCEEAKKESVFYSDEEIKDIEEKRIIEQTKALEEQIERIERNKKTNKVINETIIN